MTAPAWERQLSDLESRLVEQIGDACVSACAGDVALLSELVAALFGGILGVLAYGHDEAEAVALAKQFTDRLMDRVADTATATTTAIAVAEMVPAGHA
jgi:hypothetical protein